MKPYFRKKGKYADGRTRWIIEQKNEKGKVVRSIALPKPEEVFKILGVEVTEQGIIKTGSKSIKNWGVIRGIVLSRDNFQCFICNGSFPHFNIHHIDKNRENNQIDNLVTLCASCHKKVELHPELLDTKNIRKFPIEIMKKLDLILPCTKSLLVAQNPFL